MKSVLILLATYNGSIYIREQLDSLYNQKGVSIHILVRDDGSTDNTLEILNEYKDRFSNITILKGENIRAIRSFYSLINYVIENNLDYDYYAFCDQDDVWLENKLLCAIESLSNITNNRSLYFCAASYVDKSLKYIGPKTIKDKGNYKSCIIRNYSLGCTIVTNKSLFNDCAKASVKFQKENLTGYIPYHDVWFYSYALCTNADVIYDRRELILYRQHSSNVTTATKGRFKRYQLSYKSLCRVSNAHEQLAIFLLNTNSIQDSSVIDYLQMIATYRKNIIKTLRLFLSLDTSSCSLMDSAIWRLLVLLRKF